MLCIHIYENWKKNQERHCCKQFCGSKYIEFESGSRILAQFGSGSRFMLSILTATIENNFREKQFSLQKYIFKEQNVT